MRTYKLVFTIIMYFLIQYCLGQEISFALDSIHQLPGKDSEKLTQYYELFDLHKKNEDFTQLGSDAHQVGRWLFYKERKWKKALAATKVAIEARKKAEPFNAEMLKRSYFNYAIFNKLYGNHDISIQYFRKLIDVKGSDFNNNKAYALMGASYNTLGDPYKAIEYQLLAFKYFDPVKEKKFIVSNHINTALSYKNILNPENIAKAIIHLQTADSLIKTIEKPSIHDQYAINNNLGDLYVDKNTAKSISYFEKALGLAEKMNRTKNLAQINFNLGMNYNESDTELALMYFDKALSFAESSDNATYLIPKIYQGIGEAAFTEEDYLKAHTNYQKAFSKYLNQEIPDIHWLPSKKELVNINDKSVFLGALKLKSKTYMSQAKKDNDDTSYKNVIRTVKSADVLTDLIMQENLSYRSKLIWRSLASQIYAMGIEACYTLNDAETAFYLMEKNKALLLTQEINEKNSDIPAKILERKTDIESEIIYLQKRFVSAEVQKDSISALILDQKETLKQFKDSLSVVYPAYFTTISNPKILSLKEIKPGKDEIIIQYMIAESIALTTPQTHGIVITNNNTRFFKINDTKKLLDQVYDLRKQLNQPFTTSIDITSYTKTAYDLYEQLFPKEIQGLLKNKKVTIIPDRQLSFIPFEALVTNLDKKSYFIEESDIHYLYSLSFQKENAAVNRQHENEFLGVAPINFSNGLSTLSKSKDEIDTAKTYYEGSLLIDSKAIKDNFIQQAGDYKILHLATHADASDSIAPWIAFHDTKLTVDEINISKTNAELVVLSACNTSLGEVTHGEGVLSLARGFFSSGANTVIPSLWSTNDKTTATITSNFYKNLSEGKTKSEALRLAKLDYLKSNTDAEASPHYWAPLILIGNPDPLLPQNNYSILWIALALILVLSVIVYLFANKRKRNS